MTLQTILVRSAPSDESAFRQSVSLEKARSAGRAIANHSLDFCLRTGLLKRDEEVGCLGNLPDWKPFETIFQSGLNMRTVEIETRRTGLGNRKIEIGRKLVGREWGNVNVGVIVDSCIAGGSTQVEVLIPEVLTLGNSVKKIVCIVPISTKQGLARLEEFAKQISPAVVVVTGMIDPGVDSHGYIVPGVGPGYWTKRIPEKMGEIPMWSEYLQSWAQASLQKELQGERSSRAALEIAALTLVSQWQSFMLKPIGYGILERALQRLEARLKHRGMSLLTTSGRRLDYFDAPNISDAVNELRFLGFVDYRTAYSLTAEGRLFLDKICLPTMTQDTKLNELAEELRTIPRHLFMY